MKAGDCERKPGVLISSPCLSHHQETNHVPLKHQLLPLVSCVAAPLKTFEGQNKSVGGKKVQNDTFMVERHALVFCMYFKAV